MVQFSVSTDAVGGASAAMVTILSEFDAQLAAADTAVSSVATASWQGDAATEFLKAWQQFHSVAEQTRTALQAISMKLSGGQSTYETTEQGQVNASESQSIVGSAPMLAGSGQGAGGSEQLPVAPAAAVGSAPASSGEGSPLLADLQEGLAALGEARA